ncbi:MAG: lactate racemase domain-containing protein [Planctomycetaceae bacterium]|nr:DUF2088 domain-containing protein [Planctomycetaceae bacterium]
MPTPQRLLELRRSLPTPELTDVAGTISEQMETLLGDSALRPGDTVAIAVGSRGIAQLPFLIETLVCEFQRRGARPFLVPAMGSHGGATPAGQAQVLRNLGIAAHNWQVEIRADMETVLLGTTPLGLPVHFSREALQADHVFLCNRVKPHTRFTGPIQSGLMKMLVIGLGKQAGAAACHRLAHHIPFEQLVIQGTETILGRAPVLGGLAVIENAREHIANIAAISARDFIQREPDLLIQAESLMSRLPLEQIDLLIIDELGKEISGSGMDTNVVGRKENDHVSGKRDWCQTRLIYVRGLTAATAGNATGLGMAEFTRPEAVAEVDWQKTALNCITAGHPTAAMCPIVLGSDAAVLDAAESILGQPPRLVHIRNTLQLEHLFVSQACQAEIDTRESGLTWGLPFPLTCDARGHFTHRLQKN